MSVGNFFKSYYGAGKGEKPAPPDRGFPILCIHMDSIRFVHNEFEAILKDVLPDCKSAVKSPAALEKVIELMDPIMELFTQLRKTTEPCLLPSSQRRQMLM